MAFAADIVIVEVEELVEVGELGPDDIDVPAPIIDMAVSYTHLHKNGNYKIHIFPS